MFDFSSGYLQRALHTFPKQGGKLPWKIHQNYAKDIMLFLCRQLGMENNFKVVEYAGPGAPEGREAARERVHGLRRDQG